MNECSRALRHIILMQVNNDCTRFNKVCCFLETAHIAWISESRGIGRTSQTPSTKANAFATDAQLLKLYCLKARPYLSQNFGTDPSRLKLVFSVRKTAGGPLRGGHQIWSSMLSMILTTRNSIPQMVDLVASHPLF